MKKHIATILFFTQAIFAHEIIEKQIAILSQNPLQTTGLEHLNYTRSSIPQVTIWVHATKVLSILSDYAHATPRPGLVHISEFSWTYHLKTLLETLSGAAPQQFPLDHMYAFGWSGALSFDERKKEAQNLYSALKMLLAAYQNKYGMEPQITFITHSHGGNVLLNLAKVKEPNFTTRVQAILLGCPVQHETKQLVSDPLFEKIYSFYSASDWIQAGDPQGLYLNETNKSRHWEFSDRLFPAHPKLSQVHLKIDGDGIWHLGYLRPYFIKTLPRLLQEIDAWQSVVPNKVNQERVMNVCYY